MNADFCTMNVGELYEEAYNVNPCRAMFLKDLWENSDAYTSRDLVIGL